MDADLLLQLQEKQKKLILELQQNNNQNNLENNETKIIKSKAALL